MTEQFAEFGVGSVVHTPSSIVGASAIRIGENVHIGAGALIRGDGGLTIGDNTHISRGCVIYTVNHEYEGERLPYDEELRNRPVSIGPNVWIGTHCRIVPGTQIGEGVIVGMGTVVWGEVPPFAIIGAPRWHIIGWRDQSHYDRLCAAGQYGGANGAPLTKEN